VKSHLEKKFIHSSHHLQHHHHRNGSSFWVRCERQGWMKLHHHLCFHFFSFGMWWSQTHCLKIAHNLQYIYNLFIYHSLKDILDESLSKSIHEEGLFSLSHSLYSSKIYLTLQSSSPSPPPGLHLHMDEWSCKGPPQWWALLVTRFEKSFPHASSV
jgi:hypothetical protein